jgi:cytochrome c oxidase subunit 5b
MFKTAVRVAAVAGRSAVRPASSPALRVFSTTTNIRSDHGAPPPQLFGPGSKPGEVPTDELQATGLERLQLLGELEGVSAFDTAPLQSDRVGTKADPIMVPSLVRVVFDFRVNWEAYLFRVVSY